MVFTALVTHCIVEKILTKDLQLSHPPYNPLRQQERDFYASPVPPNSQLAPYQPDSWRPSSAHIPQPQYPPHGSQGQIVPFFEPPPLERSSSRDSRGHRRRRSNSHHSRSESTKDEKSGHATERGIGANLVGAAGGGYLGHKFAGGGVGTVLGALVGGYAAHMAAEKGEKSHRKKKEKKSREHGDNATESHGSSHRRRRGSAPLPLIGHLLPPDAGRRRRHSKSARSRSRGRNDLSDSDSDSSSADSRTRRRHHH